MFQLVLTYLLLAAVVETVKGIGLDQVLTRFFTLWVWTVRFAEKLFNIKTAETHASSRHRVFF